MATLQAEAIDFTPPAVAIVEQRNEVIGDYEILGKLGQGGMGAVYRARQISLDRTVALKILPSNLEEDETYVARFQREAAVAAGLNHPNLVHVYASGYADGSHFIAMELIEGENLRQRMKRGEIPMDESVRICLEVARGLQFAWQRAQLIHRDIKPSNIYLAADGVVKVGDLGLAKSLLSNSTAVTHTGTALGTPHYMSPEQARGEKAIDLRADIYSLGCTLYQLLTGSTPYHGTDPAAVVNMHINAPPPAILKVLPTCPILLGRLVNKMLRKSKHERHQSYEELIAAMEGVLGQLEQGTVSVGPTAVAQAWKEMGDLEAAPAAQYGMLWAGIIVVLLLAGGIAWWMMRPQPATAPARVVVSTPAAVAKPPVAQGQSTPVAQKPATVAAGTVTPRSTEPWQDLLANPAIFDPKENLARAPKGAFLHGLCHLPVGEFTDGALRASFVWRASTWSGSTIFLHARSSQDEEYLCLYGQSQDGNITIQYHKGSAFKNLRDVKVGAALAEGAVGEMEFRLVGNNLSAWWNGERVVQLVDDRIHAGGIDIGTSPAAPPLEIRSLEYLNLSAAGGATPGNARTPASATKDAPFTNSLGMKFVPVPITGGPTDKQRVLFSVWDTRVQDYEVFAKETGQHWPKPPFQQGPTHPAIFVSWEDAQAFCAWLTAREQKAGQLAADQVYRLPTDHEWSCAVGIGDREDAATLPSEKDSKSGDLFPWGTQWPPPPSAGNYWSEDLRPLFAGVFRDRAPNKVNFPGRYDGFAGTSPVGSFAANVYGLYDMGGNVLQWCEDWYDSGQKARVLRGSTWASVDKHVLHSASRAGHEATNRGETAGFRVVLAPAPAPTASTPATATKDAPFTNSLGMKFVPVPITGGPTGGQRVLFSVWETRVQDYEVFANETNRPWPVSPTERKPSLPATMVSVSDALAFCTWLTERERKGGQLGANEAYRLPTDFEWSCGAGIGAREDPSKSPDDRQNDVLDLYPWGTAWPPPANVANLSGEEAVGHQTGGSMQKILNGYRDAFPTLAPVGSFPPEANGLYDLGGNVREVCQDMFATLREHVLRGGSYEMSERDWLIISNRGRTPAERRSPAMGFRLVLAPAQ